MTAPVTSMAVTLAGYLKAVERAAPSRRRVARALVGAMRVAIEAGALAALQRWLPAGDVTRRHPAGPEEVEAVVVALERWSAGEPFEDRQRGFLSVEMHDARDRLVTALQAQGAHRAGWIALASRLARHQFPLGSATDPVDPTAPAAYFFASALDLLVGVAWFGPETDDAPWWAVRPAALNFADALWALGERDVVRGRAAADAQVLAALRQVLSPPHAAGTLGTFLRGRPRGRARR